MIQGVIKKLDNYGVSDKTGTPWISGVLEEKSGELISIVAFNDEALKLSGFSVGDEIRCAGRKNRGEDSFTIAFTEKILTRARLVTEMTDQMHEAARTALISKLPTSEDRGGEIESVMDHYGAKEITEEIRRLGFKFNSVGGWDSWKESKLKRIREKGLF